jgi:hypothetical protein
VCHFVVEDDQGGCDIIAELFFDALHFSLPAVPMRAKEWTGDKSPYRFIFTSCGWVFESSDCLVVAFDVFIEEMRIEEFGVSPGASNFVYHFLLVKELVASDSVQATEETPHHWEQQIVRHSFWLLLEPVVINAYLVWDNNERPNPSYRLDDIVGVQRDPESAVVLKRSLWLGRKILVIFWSCVPTNWTRQVN